MKQTIQKTIPFDTKKSLQSADDSKNNSNKLTLVKIGQIISWKNNIERVEAVRTGIPYEALEVISARLNRPISFILALLAIPQTSYNKKKNDQALMDRRNSELVLAISELLDYGLTVFNAEEEKFSRWLRKANQSLQGDSPESMFDTMSGIEAVKYCLDRLEYGNLA